MNSSQLSSQPLELHLQRMSQEKAKFPRMVGDYYTYYVSLVEQLKVQVYPHIDAGLSANSAARGLYTVHTAEHFDEVIRYAGDLLGAEDENWNLLEPYELYVLLIAIRIHDAGNIHGREQHERNCFKVLRDFAALLGGDTAELKIIADIAKAHGGKNNNDKDTISYLPPKRIVGRPEIRPRLLAAIVRFADEICENRGRAANYNLSHGTIPKENEIYHRYSAAISGAAYKRDEGRIMINYCLSVDDAMKKWGCESRVQLDGSTINEVYLIDEIYDRLEKMDCERKYCNVHTRGVFAVDSIRATIEIVDSDNEVVQMIPIPDLHDSGYPQTDGQRLKDKLSEYCGERCVALLTQNKGSSQQ